MAKAHLDRLQGDVDKRIGIEESLEKLRGFQERLKVKEFMLDQKIDKDEKDKQKLMEIEKLIEVSRGKANRAEDAVTAWEKVVETRKNETNKWMTTVEDQRKEEKRKRLEKRRRRSCLQDGME